MLLVRPFFAEMFGRPVADAHATTSILVCLMVDSREEVDRLCTAALASGGRKYKDAEDRGFMYGWGFEDPDGHIWEVGWMDPTYVMPQEDAA
jgi:predicted lactoylglutathione lyase